MLGFYNSHSLRGSRLAEEALGGCWGRSPALTPQQQRGECCSPSGCAHSTVFPGGVRPTAPLQLGPRGRQGNQCPNWFQFTPSALGWAGLPCAPLAQRENPRAQNGGTCPLSNEKIFIRELLTKTIHLPLTLEYILKDLILPFPVVICLHIPEK